ncbi:hypothetical protein CISG_00239 [Coccidioides immitis RMSCC 3703]|uniref:Dilute domain-containing protein n=1 Tax=Coccidioides immitis RMSCC 3703 TaxID=454286 RepID=A0A0J8QHK1_COCIT|nr:hypothetical protein CISG_00239 [Coccidioides immitis RMSCC 3703]
MDQAGPYHEASSDADIYEPNELEKPKPRALPDDLPTSLDDRRSVPTYTAETEMYDGWQGQSQFLTSPVPTKPLTFNLTLNDQTHDDDLGFRTSAYPENGRMEGSDARLMEMLAAQAAHRDVGIAGTDEDDIAADKKLTDEQKRDILQKTLNTAASNGDVERVKKLLNGEASRYVDVDLPDEEGTVPLIYASCFGHHEVVTALLEAGAQVDNQDRNRWSALMWAMTNRHKTIAKVLLDYGASPEIRSSSGGTAFDFVQPGTDISNYLQENGYNFGSSGIDNDFYDSGFGHGRFEEEMAENEIKRRMMMEESAMNLEVDLSSLGLDEKLDAMDDELEDQQEFVWDRCLHDQMFVFQEHELDRILDIIITTMTPQRSPSQKPIPANVLFLCARYAHYHASPELLSTLLLSATDRINAVVEKHQWDMTILAFWISNATLLLHYLKKDGELIRMNVSALEDWARLNNRQPEHYENGSTTCTGESTVEAARKHLEPVVELLQWLQCFSSLGDDLDSLIATLQQLPRLTPIQLLHAVKLYRPEVGEKGLPKSAMKYITSLKDDPYLLYRPTSPKAETTPTSQATNAAPSTPTVATMPGKDGDSAEPATPQTPQLQPPSTSQPQQQSPSQASPQPAISASERTSLLLDPAMTLPFSLPTSTDMLISYGAGFGGTNRDRERKYIPTVPTEFLARFDRS